MNEPVLILLRGPSASGKSTIANKLREKLTGNVAVLEFDTFRNEILGLKGDYYPAATEMYISNSKICTENGYSVILDGIFRDDENNSNLKRLIRKVRVECFLFYFDITLEETLERQKTRAKQIEERKIREWFYKPDALGVDNEHKIASSLTTTETVDYIVKTIQ